MKVTIMMTIAIDQKYIFKPVLTHPGPIGLDCLVACAARGFLWRACKLGSSGMGQGGGERIPALPPPVPLPFSRQPRKKGQTRLLLEFRKIPKITPGLIFLKGLLIKERCLHYMTYHVIVTPHIHRELKASPLTHWTTRSSCCHRDEAWRTDVT